MPTLHTETGHDVTARLQLLHALGLAEDRPVAELDDLARQLAHDTAGRASHPDGFYGFVNIIKDGHQFFAGLYIPADPDIGEAPSPAGAVVPPAARVMPLSEGWCVHVLDRRLALPLRHVKDMPRWSGNPAVSKLGAQTYLGTPLIDPRTGITFGTVAVVGKTQTDWTLEDVEFIKGYADRALTIISAQSRRRGEGR